MRFWAFLLVGCQRGPTPATAAPPASSEGPLALCVNEIAPAAARSGATDWIELFDPGAAPVSLAGWSVADASGEARPLPAGTVAPGTALVLDGDRLPIALDRDGDEVTLIAPDGSRHTVAFGATDVDRAWARTGDCCVDDGCWASVWLGTPGASNGRELVGPSTVPEWLTPTTARFRLTVPAEAVTGLDLVVDATDGARVFLDAEEVLRVGLPSGDLDAGAPALRALGAPTRARVRLPAEALVPGTEHVLVAELHTAAGGSTSLALRLHAFGTLPATEPPPEQPSGATAERIPEDPEPTALVFARDRVHELALELGAEAQAEMDAHLGEYQPGTLTFDGQLVTRVEVKRRGKGGSVRPMSAKPKLRIDLNADVPGGGLWGLGALLLDNAVQDCSSVKMPLAFDVFRLAGNPAPRSGYAHVVVDGQDEGLYYLTEEIDQRFAEEAFGDGDARVWDGSYANAPGEPLALADFRWDELDRFDQEEGTDDGGAALAAITAALDAWEAGTSSVQDVDAVLDWDSWIAHLAAEEWAGQVDGYVLMPNNDWLVIPDDGRARVVAWDTDQAFLEDTEWFEGTRWNEPGGRVAQLCVADPACAARKRSTIAALLDATEGADLHGELDRLSALTRAATLADPRRECPADAVDASRAAVAAWLDARDDQLRAVYALP